jgi:hypothetical protein
MKNIRLPITQDDRAELYITKYREEKEHASRLEVIIDMMHETIIKRNDEIDYLKRRNCQLGHDKGLLTLKIIELEKKIETLYYNAGE